MPGPSRHNRKLKARNERRATLARRTRAGEKKPASLGRTPAERKTQQNLKKYAGGPASVAARRRGWSGRGPGKRTFSAPSTPRRARRATPTLAEPPELPGILGDIQDAISGVDEAVTKAVSRELNKAPKVDFLPPAAEQTLDRVLGDNSGEFTYAERLLNAPIGAGAGLTVARTAGKVAGRVAAKQTAKQAGKKAARKTVKQRVGGAGKKLREAPAKTKQKAIRTGKKLKTPEGRAQVGGRVATAPVRRPLPATAAYTVGVDEAGLSGDAGKKAAAFVKGTVAAPFQDPIQYAGTTGRGIAGIGVAFGKGAYALGNTAVRGERALADELGIPVVGKDYTAEEVVSPVTDLAKQEWEGTKEIAGKLASGDQEKVEQTYIEELGALPFLPVPWIARKVKGSNQYRNARTRLRDRSSRKVREQREQAQPEARDGERPAADRRGRDKPVKKPRSPIRDPLTGEEYAISNLPVVRQLGGRAVARQIKNRNIRKGIANLADVESQIVARETVLDDADVQAAIGGIKVGPKAGRNTFLTRAEEAAFVVANRGIPFERERALEWIDEIEASKTPASYRVGGVRESRVLDWIRENPGVLGDPAFQQAVERVGGILKSTTTSERAQFLPVAKVAGIKTPEERLAEGVEVGGRTIRETVTNPRDWERAKATLRKRRSELREARKDGDAERVAELRNEVKVLDRRIRNFQLGYKKAERDYLDETQAFIEAEGLRTPSRLTDKETPETEGLTRFGLSGRGSQRRTSRTTQRSDGKNLARDVADRSRSANWTQSILDPRLQRVFHSLTKTVVANYGYKITVPTKSGKGRQVLEATTREHQRALDRGELPDDVVLVDAQYYRGAIGDRNATVYGFNDFLDAISGVAGRSRNSDTPDADGLPPVLTAGELRRLGREDRAADPGKKYIALDREATKELFGQVEGVTGQLSRGAAKLNRGTSNVILGYNPSFPMAQQVAEGGPAVFTAATANPLAIGRMAAAAPNRKRGTNRQRAELETMYGIPGGTYQFRQPSRNATVSQVDQLTDPRFTLPAKAKGLGYDAVRGRAINDLVLWTGAKYRRLAGLAELDRRTKRAVGGLGGLLRRYGTLQKKFRGKSLAEVERYFASNPKLRAEIRGYLNDVMGNWTTLTRLEARYAPGVAFYPYVRYSLKWAFYSYPRRHPVRASILYFLGQLNAEELEKLVDNGTVADWIDFAYPVVSKDGLPYPLPGGARFAPSASGIIESLPIIGDNNPEKALGSLNPAIKVILDAALGRESFQGEKVAQDWVERILLGAAGFFSMAAPVRALDAAGIATPITDIKPRRTWDGTVIGGRSDTAEEFYDLDPNRIERGISPFGPLIGQSAEDYRKTNRKALRVERGDYSSGSSSDSETPTSPRDAFLGGGSSSSDKKSKPTLREAFLGE